MKPETLEVPKHPEAGTGSRTLSLAFGLRFKFLLLITTLLLLIVASLTVFLIRSNASTQRQNLQRDSLSYATLATTPIGDTFSVFKDSGTVHIDQQVASFTQYNTSISNVSIIDLKGNVLYSKDKANKPKISAANASSFTPITSYDGPLQTISRIVFPYFENSSAHRYSVVYDISGKQIESQVKNESKIVIIFSIAALGFTVAAMYLLINSFILRPLYKVSQQASKVSSGDLEQEIEVSGKDEISQLGRAVNSMANSLKKSILQLKEVDKVKTEFMMITSHNLRTPLAIISGYTENENQYQTIEQYRKAMDGIATSAKRLNTFAEDILTISRFELGETTVLQEPVNLTNFIQDLSADFHIISESQHRKYISTVDSRPRIVNISRAHIRNAIWNIFDNAVKFTKDDGEISLRLDDDGTFTYITISDTGIGINENELPKLFTKFHRGTSLTRYDYEGTGIGLYASKLIIDQHGGTITASSTEGKGSTFTIKLPLAPHEPLASHLAGQVVKATEQTDDKRVDPPLS